MVSCWCLFFKQTSLVVAVVVVVVVAVVAQVKREAARLRSNEQTSRLLQTQSRSRSQAGARGKLQFGFERSIMALL